jgi:hypothetical protein
VTSANDRKRNAIRRAPKVRRPESPGADDHISPAPRVAIQAFCETVETAAAINRQARIAA